MSKLQGASSLNRRRQKKQDQKELPLQPETKITTVATRRNVTTNSKPIPVRLTENNKVDLNLWLAELEKDMGKKVTMAKLMRGLIHMHEDIDKKALMAAINAAN